MTLASLVRQPQPRRRVVRRDFDKLVDDLWGGFGLAPVAFAPSRPNFANDAFRPTFEAVELEDEYRISADLPGVEPGDIDITVEDGVLSIKGQRHYESESETEEGGVTRVDERGRFERRMRFPGEIAEADVKATCKHGVLTVSIPKPEDVKPEIKAIPVETA